jgi:hypothetical protein
MKGRWNRSSAMVGALVWTAMCVYAGVGRAPLGVLELLFLFAVLVVVPLGLVLGERISPVSLRLPHLLEMSQPFAAVAVTISFWISPGPSAGIMALPWALLCLSIALTGALSLRSTRSLADFSINVGRMDLAVAAIWLLVSRFGLRPMIFQEPIILLTAVHFHYTGFASATILAAAVKASTKSRIALRLRWFAFLVLFTPFVLAVGFVYSPLLKMFAGIAMVVAMSGLAVVQLILAAFVSSRVSRAYLNVSSATVAAAMGVAAIYVIGDWLHRDWLVIPQVAQSHGVLNALGFSLCGILGWLIELAPPSSDSISDAYLHRRERAGNLRIPEVHVLQ